MTRKISKSRADRLGDRLRRAEVPDPADLAELQRVIEEYDAPLAEAQQILREAAFSATSRLKTELTTLEKLKRENNRLSTIQDIAGLRIVIDMDLDEQDRVTQQIADLFEGARVFDRRNRPSSGYRAVHVVAVVNGFPVEVQVRTLFQDLWAQAFERFADLVGRGIRYGESLQDPDLEEARQALMRLSRQVTKVEVAEARFRRREAKLVRKPITPVPSGFHPILLLKQPLASALSRTYDALRGRLTDARVDLVAALQGIVDRLSEGPDE